MSRTSPSLSTARPPQVHPPAGDLHDHRVEMPDTGRWSAASAQTSDDRRAEARDPGPDRLVGHCDAALGEEFLDVTQAEGNAEIQPDRVLDDGLRQPNAAVRGRRHALPLPAA